MRTLRRTGSLVVAMMVVVAGLAGCGGDSTEDDEFAKAEASIYEEAQRSASAEAEEPEESDSVPAPPEERTGSYSVTGTETKLAEADFEICETINPAFADAINIGHEIPELGVDFQLIGDLPDDVRFELKDSETSVPLDPPSDTSVVRESRNVSGGFVLQGRQVEFSYDC